MTGIERIAKRNIIGACNYIVGGYYNCLQDDDLEGIPETRESVEEEIYSSALTDLFFAGGCQVGHAPKEMRFAGKDFCMSVIKDFMDSDCDALEIAEVRGW